MQVWADAKFNNLVIYDREICMSRHTHEYYIYSLGHTLGSFQAHRAAFVLNFVLVFVPSLNNSRLTVNVYIKEGVLKNVFV